ncbi:MAG: LD-carboxypeptidase [Bacteroidota bacterium]
MLRRKFLQLAPVSTLAAAGACAARPPAQQSSPRLLKPARLQTGDQVMLICPGGPINEARLQKAVANLTSLGLQPRLGKHVLAQNGFNAGTDAQRLEDLHAAFQDPNIKAVWPVRGGYGCTRLLPLIDFELIRAHPKLLIGYSDITALLLAFYQKTGLVGIHGPLGSSDFSDFNLGHLRPLIMEGAETHLIHWAAEGVSLVGGKARGPLIGGNLTLLAAMAGTPYGFDAKGKLVFIEDVGEDPYSIDRMLTQLRQSARLDQASGIILGEFVGCEADPDDLSLSLLDTLKGRLVEFGLPLVYRMPFGHGDQNCSLPIGVQAELDADTGSLRLLESATA